MNELSLILRPENVALDYPARKKEDVVRRIAELLSSTGGIDTAVLTAALMEREALCPTGLGEGVAAPHVLLPGLRDTVMAFLRTVKPVDWKSEDRKPIRLVFAMIGPAEDPAIHLRLLSRLTRLLRNPKFRSAALTAASGEELASAFRQREKE